MPDSPTTKLFPAQNYEPIFREIERATAMNDTTLFAPPMSDAAMLDTLAQWFDVKYPDDDNEVQMDLRRIAARLRSIDRR